MKTLTQFSARTLSSLWGWREVKGYWHEGICQCPRGYWRGRNLAGRAASGDPVTVLPHSLPPFCCRSSAK